MFFNSSREKLWYTIKETMNFLSRTKARTGCDKRKGKSDVRGAVEGD
jgi:hypothetical protein